MAEAQNREKMLEARRVIEAELDKIPADLAKAFADVIEASSRMVADRSADVRALRCHRDDLHEANNRYLERARKAEAAIKTHEEVVQAIGVSRERTIKRLIDERDAWKSRWEKATGQSAADFPLNDALASTDALKTRAALETEREAFAWTSPDQKVGIGCGEFGIVAGRPDRLMCIPLYLDPLASEIEALRAELGERRAEVERMTPKFVAYEYLEAPSGRETAEARPPVTLEELSARGMSDRMQEVVTIMMGERLREDARGKITRDEMWAFRFGPICACGERGLSSEEEEGDYCNDCAAVEAEDAARRVRDGEKVDV